MRWLCALGFALAASACARQNPLFDEIGGGDGGTLDVETTDGSTSAPTSQTSGSECDACTSDQLCVDGVCMCPQGLRFCDNECVDIQADGSHCGECDRLCASPTVCALGECRDECPVGTQECGDGCPPLDSPLHCGGCNIECDPDEECFDGDCVCPADHELCNGACVKLDEDPSNCGECGLACDSNMCEGGECLCPLGLACDGHCRDTMIDPLNCGDCGVTCDAMTEECVVGSCECLPLYTSCLGECVFTPTDPEFCGDCGTACEKGTLCVGGSCDGICGDPFQMCGDVCTDVRYDPNHCSECDNACANDEACIDGECLPYNAPDCLMCPCAACDAFCCEIPTLSNQVLCTEVDALSCN